MERESSILDREERESRQKSMMMIAETMTPILGQAIQVGSVFMELWIANKKEEMEANLKRQRAQRAAEENREKTEANNVSKETTQPN